MKVIFNKTKSEADIYLYEDIGDGWFGGVSAKQFADELNAIGAIDQINIRINSPGGSVFDGISMYNLIVANKSKKITVYIDGLAASIASVVAMGGDEIVMAPNALMMIHDPWGIAIGTAEDMIREAATLETVKDSIVTTYESKSGAERYRISEWMAAETWMDAATAVDRGFVDVIGEQMEQAACVDCSRYKYRNAPANMPGVEPSERPAYKAAASRIARMQARLRKMRL